MKSLALLTFIFLIIFSSCTSHDPGVDKAYEIIGSYAKEKRRKTGWYLAGTGGILGDQIDKINITFRVQEQLNLDQARILLVNGIEEFLNKVNSTPDIKKFLGHYPFTYQDIEFSLWFDRNVDFICTADLVNGKVIYSVEGNERLELAHKETYEEALRIVKSQKEIVTIQVPPAARPE